MDNLTGKSKALAILNLVVSTLIDLGVQPYEVSRYVDEYLKIYVSEIQDSVFPDAPLRFSKRHGFIVLDSINGHVTYKDFTVRLSRKEAQLFALFIENPGVLIRSNRLIQAIQADTYKSPPDQLLRIHIHGLRKKLAQIPGGNKWIVTDYKKGFLREAVGFMCASLGLLWCLGFVLGFLVVMAMRKNWRLPVAFLQIYLRTTDAIQLYIST